MAHCATGAANSAAVDPGPALPVALRLIQDRPLRARNAATASNRGRCRGASTSNAVGCAVRKIRCASSAARSSPACVLPATHMGRASAYFARSALPRSRTEGAGSRSNLRLPPTWMRAAGTPREAKRRASASDCASTDTPCASAGCSRDFRRRRRAALRSDSRALTNNTGTPARVHSASRFGQTSVSAISNSAGRNRRSVPRRHQGRS